LWTPQRPLGKLCTPGRRGGEGAERGVNTRYIFGFTEGADTERAREKEV
jgi:hypothetical protein